MPGRDSRDHWDDEEAGRGRYGWGEDRGRYERRDSGHHDPQLRGGGGPRLGATGMTYEGSAGDPGTSGRYYEDEGRRADYGGFSGGAQGYGAEPRGGGRAESRRGDAGYRDPSRRANYRTERGYTRQDEDAIGGPYTDYGHAMGGYGAGGGYTPTPDEGVGRERRSWDERYAPGSWFGQAPGEGWRDARRSFEGLRGEGPHRGRGPKGYTRSGERIREDVSDRLTDDPQLDASDIEVLVEGTEVTLNGTVDSRAAKRRAEDRADDVTGVTHVQNNLRVRAARGSIGAETDPRIAAISEGRDPDDAPEHMRREEG